MLRTILGVILGYVAMAVLIFLTFTLAYLTMGSEGAFQPGTYEVTALWLVVSFVLSLVFREDDQRRRGRRSRRDVY